jgi:hypothetical protein
MHPDDLRKVWLCCECRRTFAFTSDIEDHKRQFKHSKIMLYNLENYSKESPPQLFMRGRVSIDFRLGNEPSRIIVEYEYYPSTSEIKYIDVRYTNSRLKSLVENDPKTMKNIDSYLRKLLIQELPVNP